MVVSRKKTLLCNPSSRLITLGILILVPCSVSRWLFSVSSEWSHGIYHGPFLIPTTELQKTEKSLSVTGNTISLEGNKLTRITHDDNKANELKRTIGISFNKKQPSR
jgi:hypothetical protein